MGAFKNLLHKEPLVAILSALIRCNLKLYPNGLRVKVVNEIAITLYIRNNITRSAYCMLQNKTLTVSISWLANISEIVSHHDLSPSSTTGFYRHLSGM